MTSSKFQFTNPELLNLSFQINEDFIEDCFSGLSIKGETLIRRSTSLPQAEVTFSLRIGEQNEKYPFFVAITMKAEFQWDDSMELAMVSMLLKANAPSMLLSYMRPIVSNLTASSKYPAFQIPFMNMQDNEATFI